MHCPDFSSSHVVVLGDAMLDRYMHGDTFRISPEAPVPVVNIENEEERVGGGANVAVNLSVLGVKSTLVAAIGEDTSGRRLTELLQSSKVDCDLIESQFINTTTKLRIIGRHQQLIRLDFEKFYPWPARFLIPKITPHLTSAKVLVISDYAKGMIHEPKEIIRFAKEKGVKVIVDPKNMDLCVYQGADMITPNMKEFEASVGVCHSEDEIVKKSLNLIQQNDFNAVLVTRGAQGMTLVEKGGRHEHIPSLAREVFDITGAGDTVIAVLAACVGLGKDYSYSAKLANVAAGISVGKLGTATITPEEIEHELISLFTQSDKSGIVSKEQLVKEREKRKTLNEKVIMTNGCFDILHTGHLSYLEEARALGDCLVVAVNDDSSVKRLKGDERPLNSLPDRMKALAALKCVDYVVSFSQDTPQALIADILPDILVKGGDYQVSQIAGAKEVIENGGEVKIIPFVDGYSTTNLIEKIYQTKQTVGEVV